MLLDATAPDEVLKPRTDARLYRCVELGNQLQALLISDRDTDKVKAAQLPLHGRFHCGARAVMSSSLLVATVFGRFQHSVSALVGCGMFYQLELV